jgi:hypothetical protein
MLNKLVLNISIDLEQEPKDTKLNEKFVEQLKNYQQLKVHC